MMQPLSGNTPTTGTQSPVTGEFSRLREALNNMQLSGINLEQFSNADIAALKKMLTPKMTPYIPHTPTAKQAAFMLLDCEEAFYGGAAGGG